MPKRGNAWLLDDERKLNKFWEKSTLKINVSLFSPLLPLYLEDVFGGLVSEIISPVTAMIPFHAQWCPVTSRSQTPSWTTKAYWGNGNSPGVKHPVAVHGDPVQLWISRTPPSIRWAVYLFWFQEVGAKGGYYFWYVSVFKYCWYSSLPTPHSIRQYYLFSAAGSVIWLYCEFWQSNSHGILLL